MSWKNTPKPMNNPSKTFSSLRTEQTRKKITIAVTGKEFEQRFVSLLESNRFFRCFHDDFPPQVWKSIKVEILKKTNGGAIDNATEKKSHFVTQPYGSQQYPDFLVFEDSKIWAIETKFNKRKASHPFWNSGLPRPNGIYIYAYGIRKQITFFVGKDVVQSSIAEQMHGQLDELKMMATKFNQQELSDQPHGFMIEVRKAFSQSKRFNRNAILDFITNPNREDLEKDTIAFLNTDKNESRAEALTQRKTTQTSE